MSPTRPENNNSRRGNSVAFSESLDEHEDHSFSTPGGPSGRGSFHQDSSSINSPHKLGYTEQQKQRLAETNTILMTSCLNFFDLAGGDLFEGCGCAQVNHLEECVRLLSERQEADSAARKAEKESGRKEFSTSNVDYSPMKVGNEGIFYEQLTIIDFSSIPKNIKELQFLI